MQILPKTGIFRAAYESAMPQVIWTRLVADLETPVSAMFKLARDQENSFLLESVEGGAVRGRYSIIGLAPDIIWRANGAHAEINRTAHLDPDGPFVPCKGDALSALRALIEGSHIDLPEELPPMAAGVFGYIGYDMVRLMEKLPERKRDPDDLPDAIMIRPSIIAIFDSVRDEVTVVTPVWPDPECSAQAAHDHACTRLQSAVNRLNQPLDRTVPDRTAEAIAGPPASNTTPEAYMEMVERAKEYISAGDIFQVVLSQRFSQAFTLPPFALYRALRRTNPSPFLYYLNFSGFSVVGSSPEILVRVRDETVTIRPIAGTRPRGATRAEDQAFAEELLADPKECAEHLMLLDLGRNDVGRVARIGSVEVTDRFGLEYYSQVMHIVSNVEGRLADNHDTISALIAGFPAGTVSGAPKVRAMEIIDELEPDRRGIYAGCVGYFSADGEMDTCIVLRTAIVRNGVMYVQAGAGIVADSVPEKEHLECLNKAKALFHAAEEAVRFAGQSS